MPYSHPATPPKTPQSYSYAGLGVDVPLSNISNRSTSFYSQLRSPGKKSRDVGPLDALKAADAAPTLKIEEAAAMSEPDLDSAALAHIMCAPSYPPFPEPTPSYFVPPSMGEEAMSLDALVDYSYDPSSDQTSVLEALLTPSAFIHSPDPGVSWGVTDAPSSPSADTTIVPSHETTDQFLAFLQQDPYASTPTNTPCKPRAASPSPQKRTLNRKRSRLELEQEDQGKEHDSASEDNSHLLGLPKGGVEINLDAQGLGMTSPSTQKNSRAAPSPTMSPRRLKPGPKPRNASGRVIAPAPRRVSARRRGSIPLVVDPGSPIFLGDPFPHLTVPGSPITDHLSCANISPMLDTPFGQSPSLSPYAYPGSYSNSSDASQPTHSPAGSQTWLSPVPSQSELSPMLHSTGDLEFDELLGLTPPRSHFKDVLHLPPSPCLSALSPTSSHFGSPLMSPLMSDMTSCDDEDDDDDGRYNGRMSKSELAQHYRTQQSRRSKDKKQYICQVMEGDAVCGNIYARKSAVQNHIQTHFEDKPFQCPNCDAAFVRHHDLRRHARSHSDEKPHVCKCGKGFARSDALKRHRERRICNGAIAN